MDVCVCVCVCVYVWYGAVVYEIAQLLDVGLDKKTLSILIALCEHGVNPEALAAAVKELQREAAAIQRNTAAGAR